MSILLGIAVGIGLSAACGFRVFLPLLMMSAGSFVGYMKPPLGMDWLATFPALTVLGVATVVEVLGYLFPWVDHGLDALSIPLASAAGTLVTASFLVDLDPSFRWSLGLIAGGGTAGGVRAGLATVRAASSATTGGIANPIVGLIEGLLSFIMTIVAILAPFLAIGLLLALAYAAYRLVQRLRRMIQANPDLSREPAAP